MYVLCISLVKTLSDTCTCIGPITYLVMSRSNKLRRCTSQWKHILAPCGRG